jgi:RimJ/RimL family protein N-acetyltransferase
MTLQDKTTKAPLTVRVFTPDDTASIAAIKTDAATRAYGDIWPAPVLDAWLATHCDEEFIEERCTAPGSLALVALAGTTLVGTARLGRKSTTTAYLADVYVTTPGQGVGRTIVEALLDLAVRQFRSTDVHCCVVAQNLPAREFFESCGFTLTGLTPNTQAPGDLALYGLDL